MSIPGLFNNGSRIRRSARRRRATTPHGWIRDCLLEDRCMLTSGVTFPGPFVQNLDQVFPSADYLTAAYEKTITITNNNPTQYLFAFLEGANSRQAVSPYEGTAAFDPYDPSNQEYRGYIGYTDGTTDYAGLPPLSTITITVPLAFWDGGRIIFSTDGADQFSTYGGNNGETPPGAPFNFLDANTQATFFGNISSSALNQLDFTPVYNTFDATNGGMPTTSDWKSPVTEGLFQNGQTYNVTGPGLPAGGEMVTINSADPGFITLPNAAGAAQTAQQYTFTLTSGPSISATDRYIQGGFALDTQGSADTTNGVVMWYHALNSSAPNNLAPFQLTEISFRGTFYDPTINTGTGFEDLIGTTVFNQGVDNDSADYDLSFVDSLNVPVAVEASNVTIPSNGSNTPASAAVGWVGSGQSETDLQAAISAFASANPNAATNDNYLGTYFGGQGYPTFQVVDPGDVKLPSGQNLFLSSVASGSNSDIFFNMQFSDGTAISEPYPALSNGDIGPLTLLVGGDPAHPSQGHALGLNTSAMADHYALTNFIEPNVAAGHTYDVTYNDNGVITSIGTITSMAMVGNAVVGVNISGTVPANAASQVYTFTLANTDYAATPIAGLWYSWANYYVANIQSTPASNVAGTLADGNILTLTDPTAGLVPGMVVTATGLPAGCIILSVSSDDKTIELSEVPQGSNNPTSFSFAAPSSASIASSNPNSDGDVNLSFPSSEQAFATAFSQTIFVVMSAWSASVPAGTANGWNTLLGNIIGGNVSSTFIPNTNVDIVNELTVLSKSALRGVPDYTNPLYSNQEQWYPDPALPAGGQTYNAFNLDPFVWFVHEKLGLTAYAFALDDDIGNVLVPGGSNLEFAIGGIDDGLQVKDPYTNVAPFGVVTTTSLNAQANSGVLGGLSDEQIVYQISAYDYNQVKPGTLVNAPGVPMGTTAQFLTINSQQLANSDITLSNPLTSSTAGTIYSFFGPLTFTGTVLGQGQADDTILLNGVDAYNTLEKIGPLQNIQVTGEGIDPGSTVTIKQLTMNATTGVITLELSSPLDPTMVSQPGSFYAYTFGSAVVPLIHDPDFEWGNVQALTGGFFYGAPLTHSTVDWTFTDAGTTSAPLYAGIAYGNTSTYTTGNQLPPAGQGLQVGFIQGNSSISQIVTLPGGAYTLSLDAAQSATAQSAQSLNVLIDGMVIGTIQATGTSYQIDDVRFTATAGQHTIEFVGNGNGDSTMLIDAIALTPRSSFTAPPPSLALLPIASQSVNIGSADSFTATASGSASTLTYSLDPGAPTGATIDPVTGIFTWTPAAPGTYSVTVRATENGSSPQSDAEIVSITVNDVAPVVRLNPALVLIQGARFGATGSIASPTPGSFVADVDFGDGTGLQPLPLGSSGAFVLAHTYTRPGTYTVTVGVQDAFGVVGTATLGLTATATPLVSGYGRGHDAFVTEVYLKDLGRLPDERELKLWSKRLESGVDREAVALRIWDSKEHRELVKSGLVARIRFRRSYRDATIAERQTIRHDLPPPAGPLNLRVTGP